MILSCFFFSLMAVGVKYSLTTLPFYEVVFFRCAISAVIFGIMLKRRQNSFRGFNEKALVVRSLAGFAAILCNFYAIANIPLGDASLLVNSSPLFVVILSAIFLKEKISRPLLFLILLSAFGIMLVLRPSFHWLNLASLSGLASGLAAGFFAAVAFVTIHELHETESSLTIAFYFTTIASLGSLPLMLPHFRLPVGPERWFILLSGLFGTVGQLLMTKAYRYEQASRISSLITVSVIFAFGWGLFLFHEKPTVLSLVGSLVTIIALALIINLRREPVTLRSLGS